MPSQLDPLSFPHIVEAILVQTDRKTLLAARLVSTSMLRLVDPLFCHTRLFLMQSASGHLQGSSSMALRPSTSFKPHHRVPCFHRDGDEAIQAAAVSRIGHISLFPLFNQSARKHAGRLLQHVRSDAFVGVYHDSSLGRGANPPPFDSDLIIPPCTKITVTLSQVCTCSRGGVFRHEAGAVELEIDGRLSLTHTINSCAVMAGIINPGVTELIISGKITALPSVLLGISVQANPDLDVIFESYTVPSAEAMADLRSFAAERFSIPEDHISFDYM